MPVDVAKNGPMTSFVACVCVYKRWWCHQMSKRQNDSFYYGEQRCEYRGCSDQAYWRSLQSHILLCAHHSVDTDCVKLQRRDCERLKQQRLAPRRGTVTVRQMRTKEVVAGPECNGVLHVFPNTGVRPTNVGMHCHALSPWCMGPVPHRQPGLPDAGCLENYWRYSQVWPCETSECGDYLIPMPAQTFYDNRLIGYNARDQRYKFEAKTMNEQRLRVNSVNAHAPLYFIHQALDGVERIFTHVESRYFYCMAYVRLASRNQEFAQLQSLVEQGTDLVIHSFGRVPDPDLSPWDDYCREDVEFTHEMVLWAMLRLEPRHYPWHYYWKRNAKRYENMAHVL